MSKDSLSSSFADNENNLSFKEKIKETHSAWKILIVDDETELHDLTKLGLNNFQLDGKGLNFISAYSGKEAKQLIEQHPDTALVLLNIVMETKDAGLEVIKYIREVLNNQFVRIILRTEESEQAPEKLVILNYDINDYKTKTELTTPKLFTIVVTALKTFIALTNIEKSKRELETIAAASARFVPREFLKFLNRQSIVDAKLGDSVQAEMTILFADIRSFTRMSEGMSLQENFDFINDYLSWVCPVIRRYNGFIDKYIGDAIMALFPEKAEDAVRAAIDMQKQVALYNIQRQKKGEKPIAIGIGLHTGSLMLGTIGDEQRMESTVISDAVNLASHLEGLTKLYGVEIVFSAQTLSQLDDPQKYSCRFLDRVRVKGKRAPVGVFELYESNPQPLKDIKTETKTDFERGIFLFHQQQFHQAQQIFEQLLKVNQKDGAVRLYLKSASKKCRQLKSQLDP
ncbi:adenylate/guanylate cyclase domain-containing protein [Lyngbya aestuarii]|uniref:adenylate/guanylate cyclase domain-containing protein n=1 Tax=Lyngbya aestuarii TaxID=118322 RepID=UPI00403E108E